MKFSVIIPVFNVAPYLRECLDSVWVAAGRMNQEAVVGDPMVEVVCVDDGSTDGSSQILDEYSNSDADCGCKVDIKVIHQANSGVSMARNAAIEIARGDYLCFVDGDDWVREDYFCKLSKVIADGYPDIVRFNGSGNEFRTFVGSVIAWNACYKRGLLGGIRFEPIPNGEDILFAAEAFVRARKVVSVNEQLYGYRMRPGSAVHSVSLRHIQSKCKMCKLLKQRIKHADINRKLRTHLTGETLNMMPSVPRHDRAEAWASYFDALLYCSWSLRSRFCAMTKSRVAVFLLLRTEFWVRKYVAKARSSLKDRKFVRVCQRVASRFLSGVNVTEDSRAVC